jgi:hypothetical protein
MREFNYEIADSDQPQCNTNKRKIPVFRGAEKPLIEPYHDAKFWHGEDGLGDISHQEWYYPAPVPPHLRPVQLGRSTCPPKYAALAISEIIHREFASQQLKRQEVDESGDKHELPETDSSNVSKQQLLPF